MSCCGLGPPRFFLKEPLPDPNVPKESSISSGDYRGGSSAALVSRDAAAPPATEAQGRQASSETNGTDPPPLNKLPPLPPPADGPREAILAQPPDAEVGNGSMDESDGEDIPIPEERIWQWWWGGEGAGESNEKYARACRNLNEEAVSLRHLMRHRPNEKYCRACQAGKLQPQRSGITNRGLGLAP